jgi:hypothetical protein
MLCDDREEADSAYLASLVLGDLVLGVLLAVLALAVGAASLGNVHLEWIISMMLSRDVTLDGEVQRRSPMDDESIFAHGMYPDRQSHLFRGVCLHHVSLRIAHRSIALQKVFLGQFASFTHFSPSPSSMCIVVRRATCEESASVDADSYHLGCIAPVLGRWTLGVVQVQYSLADFALGKSKSSRVGVVGRDEPNCLAEVFAPEA